MPRSASDGKGINGFLIPGVGPVSPCCLGPHLPQIIRPFQLLEILLPHARQLSHRAQHPQNLLRLLRAQRIKNFLCRACPGSGPLELDFQHLKSLTPM